MTASLLIANCAHLVIVVLASHRRQNRSLVSAAVGADADALNVAKGVVDLGAGGRIRTVVSWDLRIVQEALLFAGVARVCRSRSVRPGDEHESHRGFD